MKIRLGFVTNSSSSSFILGFKNEKDMLITLMEQIPKGYYSRVLEDVMNSVVTHKEAIARYRSEISGRVYDEVWDKKVKETGDEGWCSSHVIEYQNIAEARLDKEAEVFAEKIKRFPYLAYLEYYSNLGETEANLEFNVMPKLKCCIASVDKH